MGIIIVVKGVNLSCSCVAISTRKGLQCKIHWNSVVYGRWECTSYIWRYPVCMLKWLLTIDVGIRHNMASPLVAFFRFFSFNWKHFSTPGAATHPPWFASHPPPPCLLVDKRVHTHKVSIVDLRCKIEWITTINVLMMLLMCLCCN